jgi:hypothetical protein
MSEKPLSNRKLEIVAQQLAKGATAAEAPIADSRLPGECRRQGPQAAHERRTLDLFAYAMVVRKLLQLGA